MEISLNKIKKKIEIHNLESLLNRNERTMLDGQLDKEAIMERIEFLKKELINRYHIYFCFVDKDGRIEQDEFEQEKYYSEIIEAETQEEALKKFYNNFENKPEVVDIIKE